MNNTELQTLLKLNENHEKMIQLLERQIINLNRQINLQSVITEALLVALLNPQGFQQNALAAQISAGLKDLNSNSGEVSLREPAADLLTRLSESEDD